VLKISFSQAIFLSFLHMTQKIQFFRPKTKNHASAQKQKPYCRRDLRLLSPKDKNRSPLPQTRHQLNSLPPPHKT
jgi:hypothetical protein